MIVKPNKNLTLIDERADRQDGNKALVAPNAEVEILQFVKERYVAMKAKKKDLGIDYKCDLFDRLYTPHRVLRVKDRDREFEESTMQIDDEDGRKANKSKPIAFEKVQTALALIIRENPKALMKPDELKYQAFNEIVRAVYEKNWEDNDLILELRRFVFHLAKYGLAYGRRYVKKTYKVSHENGLTKRMVDFYDTIWETVHPRHVYLDETCSNPRDARDCLLVFNRSLQELKDRYPESRFSKMKSILSGSALTEQETSYLDASKQLQNTKEKKIEELIYENVKKDIRLIIISGILLTAPEAVLPGHQLSIFGEKWAEKDDTYDGIGICDILENYQPLIDEISNSDIDLTRELIRPTLYMSSNLTLADEGEDEIKGQRVVRFDGDINQGLKWDRPPRGFDGQNMLEYLSREIDDSTGIAKDLSAISDAKTLGQATFNRENSLRRLALPLMSIKQAIKDDANKALNLFREVYGVPKVVELTDETAKEEARAALTRFPADERFVAKGEKIYHRQFKQMSLNVNFANGQYERSDESKFWELIPANFDWKGVMDIIPMSFIPRSEAMEQQAALQDLNIFLNFPTVDPQTGQPTMVDEQGKPYKVNKLLLARDYFSSRSKDKDKYVVPLTPQNQEGVAGQGPLTNPVNLMPTQGERQLAPGGAERAKV